MYWQLNADHDGDAMNTVSLPTPLAWFAPSEWSAEKEARSVAVAHGICAHGCAAETIARPPLPPGCAEEVKTGVLATLTLAANAITGGIRAMHALTKHKTDACPRQTLTPAVRNAPEAQRMRTAIAGGARVVDRMAVHDKPYCDRVITVEGVVPPVEGLEREGVDIPPLLAGSLFNGDVVVYYPSSGVVAAFSSNLDASKVSDVPVPVPYADSALTFHAPKILARVPLRETSTHPAHAWVSNDHVFIRTGSSVYSLFAGMRRDVVLPSNLTVLGGGIHTAVHALKTDGVPSDMVYLLGTDDACAPSEESGRAAIATSFAVLVPSLMTASTLIAATDVIAAAVNGVQDVLVAKATVDGGVPSTSTTAGRRADVFKQQNLIARRNGDREEATSELTTRLGNLRRIERFPEDAMGISPVLPSPGSMFLPLNAATQWEHATTTDKAEERIKREIETGRLLSHEEEGVADDDDDDGVESGVGAGARRRAAKRTFGGAPPLIRRYTANTTVNQQEPWTHAVAWAPSITFDDETGAEESACQEFGMLVATASALMPRVLVTSSRGRATWVATSGFVQIMATFGTSGLAFGVNNDVFLVDAFAILNDAVMCRPTRRVAHVGQSVSPTIGLTASDMFCATAPGANLDVASLMSLLDDVTVRGNAFLQQKKTETPAVTAGAASSSSSAKRQVLIDEDPTHDDDDDDDDDLAALSAAVSALDIDRSTLSWLINDRGSEHVFGPKVTPPSPVEEGVEMMTESVPESESESAPATSTGTGTGTVLEMKAAFAHWDGLLRIPFGATAKSDLDTMTALAAVQVPVFVPFADGSGGTDEVPRKGEVVYRVIVDAIVGQHTRHCELTRRKRLPTDPPGMYIDADPACVNMHKGTMMIANSDDLVLHPVHHACFVTTSRRKTVLVVWPDVKNTHPAHLPWHACVPLNEMHPEFKSASPEELRSTFVNTGPPGTRVLAIHKARPQCVTWLIFEDDAAVFGNAVQGKLAPDDKL